MIDQLFAANEVDLVQFEFSQMGCYEVAAGTPTVLDVHNIEHDLLRQMAEGGSGGRRLFNLIEYRKFRREEIASWKKSTRCIATSDADAAVIADHIDCDVPVVPNGVDLDFFRSMPESEANPGTIVFVGAMRYRPNADAARFFVEKIFPFVKRSIPNARFAIVGADPLPDVLSLKDTDGVTVTGTVSDVRPWLRSSQVVVVPLLSGGGTRLKILEAFAAGRPVVATTVGAAGLDVINRQHLLLANDASEFADRVIELANDVELRSVLTTNALELVRDKYQWSAISNTLNGLHEELVDRYGKRRRETLIRH